MSDIENRKKTYEWPESEGIVLYLGYIENSE